jgi:dimeric dUTPase (all-alpha-NTP-PPase superfamily)
MIYQCVKDFEISVINENGMMTERILKITSGMFFKESKDNILSGAEIKLENIFDDTFIEISKETLKSLFKDIEFSDLLELQIQLDEEVAKPRENGFVPRERTLLDIKLALDDEFQEWLRELPQELNFKTWKKKEYKREDELIEITDCLFFILQWVNANNFTKSMLDIYSRKLEIFEKAINENLRTLISMFKNYLWTDKTLIIFSIWICICIERGFTKDEIIQAYLTKWKRNMRVRIKEDWSL